MLVKKVVDLAMKENLVAKTAMLTKMSKATGFEKIANVGKTLEAQANLTKGLKCSPHQVHDTISPARKIIQKADSTLRRGIKLNNMEIPADTFLKELPSTQRKAVAGLLGNPDIVVCSAKANTKGSGYSILGFIGKKGDKTVGKGAVSVSEFGTPKAVAKWRYNGKNLRTNGFADCAKNATTDEISIIPSFMNKMFGIRAQAGKAANLNVQTNAKKVVDILPEGEINITNTPQNGFKHIINIVKNTIGVN